MNASLEHQIYVIIPWRWYPRRFVGESIPMLQYFRSKRVVDSRRFSDESIFQFCQQFRIPQPLVIDGQIRDTNTWLNPGKQWLIEKMNQFLDWCQQEDIVRYLVEGEFVPLAKVDLSHLMPVKRGPGRPPGVKDKVQGRKRKKKKGGKELCLSISPIPNSSLSMTEEELPASLVTPESPSPMDS